MKIISFIIINCIFFLVSIDASCQQYIAVINSTSKTNPNLIKLNFKIEYYKKDTLSIVKQPPIYIYDTLNFTELDSNSIMSTINARFNDFKLIAYTLFSDNGIPKYELSHNIRAYLEQCNWCNIQETYFDENGNKLKQRFSTSPDFAEKERKELSRAKVFPYPDIKIEFLFKNEKVNENITYTQNEISEKITYYDNGHVKEITHFNNGKIVGVHESYSRDGEISKLEIYDLMGYLTFSFERSIGAYKINGIRFNDKGEKDE